MPSVILPDAPARRGARVEEARPRGGRPYRSNGTTKDGARRAYDHDLRRNATPMTAPSTRSPESTWRYGSGTAARLPPQSRTDSPGPSVIGPVSSIALASWTFTPEPRISIAPG